MRFFTRQSVVKMVADAGLHITGLWGTVLDPLSGEVEIDAEALPGSIVNWVRHQPDALTYQFVVRAELGRPENFPVPELRPAIDLPPVNDAHSARFELAARERRVLDEEVPDLRRRVLTLRDHAIGAEAEIGVARAEIDSANASMRAAVADLAAVKASRTWRAGRMLTSPLGIVRRVLHRS
jgi:hypothetical protein